MITNISRFVLVNESSAAVVRRTREMSMEEAVDTYMANCADFPIRDTVHDGLYRGLNRMPDTFRCGVIDPSATARNSKDNTNHYNLILANSPDWADYPDRLRSVIFTNSIDIAGDYGDVYYMVPFDDAKLAVAPFTDIWDCFPGIVAVTGFTFNGLNALFKDAGVPDDSWESMKGAMDRKYEEWKTNPRPEHMLFNKLFTRCSTEDISWDEVLGLLMRPADRNFYTTYDRARVMRADHNEVWTDGKCLLVARKAMVEFRTEVLRRLEERA